MTITVIIEAKVTDFEEWIVMFNNLEEQRQTAGIYFKAYQNQDTPNTSFVLGTVPSKEAFLEFFNSPERVKIQQTLITEMPKVTFLKSV